MLLVVRNHKVLCNCTIIYSNKKVGDGVHKTSCPHQVMRVMYCTVRCHVCYKNTVCVPDHEYVDGYRVQIVSAPSSTSMTCRAVLGDLHVILHDVAFDSKVSWLTALLKKQTQLHVIAAAVDSLHIYTVCMYACVLIHVTRLQQGFTYTVYAYASVSNTGLHACYVHKSTFQHFLYQW